MAQYEAACAGIYSPTVPLQCRVTVLGEPLNSLETHIDKSANSESQHLYKASWEGNSNSTVDAPASEAVYCCH